MHLWVAPSAFFPHRGGVEELTFQLGLALQARGHSVRIVTHRHPPSLEQHETVETLVVSRMRFSAPTANAGALARFIGGECSVQRALDALSPLPDLVHIQCPSVQTAPLVLYARRHRIPLVVTSQGEVAMDANQIYQHSAFMRLSFRIAARSAAALTACSTWTAAQCTSFAPRFAEATVIPNGVSPEQWDVGPPPREPVLCAWGRHVPQKGFDLAIEAFAVLRDRIPDALLVIGGDGVETPRLRAMAGDGIEFVGALDREGVRRLLARSRAAVVPSRIEPFGIVALEALAAGRGLVYAAGTGLVEAAGQSGRPADVNDREGLAAAMESELVAPTAPATGRAWALDHSWDRICDRYLSVYRMAGGSAREQRWRLGELSP